LDDAKRHVLRASELTSEIEAATNAKGGLKMASGLKHFRQLCASRVKQAEMTGPLCQVA